MSAHHDRPMAAAGLISYRYPSRYGGWVMIGARGHEQALQEAGRSVDGHPAMERLQVWDGSQYVSVTP